MAAQTLVQVQLVLRLTLGLIFLLSAVAKLRDPAAFVQGVLEYRVLPAPLARVYGRALPFVELGTALLLLSGILLVLATGVAVLMLISFAVAIAIVTLQGHSLACNCFGVAQRSVVGWYTLVRDVFCLLPAVWLLTRAVSGQAGNSAWPPADIDSAASPFIVALVFALCYLLMTEVLGLLGSFASRQGRRL
jgi:uncharacterized membrane protein YphA (DoxX/SURF4 family)